MLANQETTYANECSIDATLRWMCNKTRKDRNRNERIWEHQGVALIGDKLTEPFKMVWTIWTSPT